MNFSCSPNVLSMIIDNGNSSRIRCGTATPPPQQTINYQSRSTLLATDTFHSPHATDDLSIAQLAFMPFGFTPHGSAVIIGFKGERYDSGTGCYLLGNGYRAYSPVLMRFNTPDSYSPFGNGDINSYSFVSNNPINFSDPSGHMLEALTQGLRQNITKAWKNLGNALAGIDIHKPTKMLELQSVENTADNIVRGKAYYNGKLVNVIVSHGTKGRLHGINPNQDADYGINDIPKLLPKPLKSDTIILAACYGNAVGPEGVSMAQAIANHYDATVLASTEKILFNEVPINSPPSDFVVYKNFNSAPSHLQGIGTHFNSIYPQRDTLRGKTQ